MIIDGSPKNTPPPPQKKTFSPNIKVLMPNKLQPFPTSLVDKWLHYSEWLALKGHVKPIVINETSMMYLDV